MSSVFNKILLCFLMCFLQVAFATENIMSLNLQNVNIQDVLHLLIKSQHKNMVISPSIHGTTSLQIHNMNVEDALDMVLAQHDLHKWKINNTFFVGSREEFFEQKELEKKVKGLEYETQPLVTRIWQIRYAKAVDIARLLQDAKNTLITGRGSVSVDVRTNRLCVRDIASSMESINTFISALDIPVRQVFIEARIASIDSDYERDLGINFSVNSEQDNNEPSVILKPNARYSLAILSLPDGSRLNMQLSALERTGHGELISSPSLYTASQQTAVIESGEEIPYQETSRNGATSVTFKKAVLSLKVTPQIMPNDQILLQMQVNQDKPSKRMVLGVPAINTRHITTSIQIKSGQTVVLGGIYEFNHEQDEERIPFLGSIPLIGWLFKQQNKLKNKRELFIFVTPRIIS